MDYINCLMKFARKQLENPNSLMCGMSGSGKAFTFGKVITFVAKRDFSESERLLK